MMEIFYIALTYFGLWVGVTGWFFALSRAIQLRDEEVEFNWVIKVPIWTFLVLGFVVDILFNWLIGTFIFMEFPREFVFTDRVQRQYRKGNKRAAFWVDVLNKIEPGHIL